MKIYNYLLNTISAKGAAYLILIDPDKIIEGKMPEYLTFCEESGVDAFMIGGSLMMNNNFEEFTRNVKENTKLPLITFPGSINQISSYADAILFLSVISGRNPEHLIGKHVQAAPAIKEINLETISVGYILIESGSLTTAQYFDGSLPLPRNKPEIASATALAAEYLGMKFIYLEAGSGAENTVPCNMIKKVSEYCSLPVIVGGGIKNPFEAREKVESGASIVVTGNHFENENNWKQIKIFADAIHKKSPVKI